jgi:proteasome lid subunit RPN8/RPN11
MKTIQKITLDSDVVHNIISFAHANHPKEFIAILEGQLKEDELVITGLIYQPYHSSHKTSIMRLNLPPFSHAVGSVHSHPSGTNIPSMQDLEFFGKNGIVHMIISYPYGKEDIGCYDSGGQSIVFNLR